MATITRERVAQIAQGNGVPPGLAYKVINAESAWNPNARSGVGAQGLMQLMPGTARDLKVANPWDPEQNVEGGTRYLGQQLRKYGGDERLALMAYNWGPGSVDNYLAKQRKGKNPSMPAETQKYVNRILGSGGGNAPSSVTGSGMPPGLGGGMDPAVMQAYQALVDSMPKAQAEGVTIPNTNWITVAPTDNTSVIPLDQPQQGSAGQNYSLNSALKWLGDFNYGNGKPI